MQQEIKQYFVELQSRTKTIHQMPIFHIGARIKITTKKKKKGWINAGSYPASIARFPDEFGKYYLLKIIGPERLV